VQATRKLDLGCGNAKHPGYIGVDNNPNANQADVIWDLNVVPWPFEDESVDEVLADHVLEHLDDPLRFLAEVYRILKPGCRLILNVPHFSCAWLHPMHKRAFSTLLFSYFDPMAPEHYGNLRFRVVKMRLHWHRPTLLLKKGL
jgi:predicted SAM-dependent methyltransferase